MDILFWGLNYDRFREDEYIQLSKVGLQSAANTYQWNLIDGLINSNCTLNTISCLPVGTWPRFHRKIALESRNWIYRGAEFREIGSINIPIGKQVMRCAAFYKTTMCWAQASSENRNIIAYSLYLPFMIAIRSIKKHFSDLKVCLIVTDLPCEYGILPKSKVKAFIYRFYGKIVLRLTKHVDSFVLLTEQMQVPLNIRDRTHVVIEGIASDSNNTIFKNTYGGNNKVILYTGTLHYQFGVVSLLDAFSLIKESDYELWIAGSGEAADEIKDRSMTDSRIKYFGFVAKEEVYKLQSQATILINPRKNEGEYTKYSFPSKTIEYMASGVPVIMHKLSGIPDEYDRFLLYFKGQSISAMAESIVEVCEKDKDELQRLGIAAREFVLNHKNSQGAARKILNMLRE